MICESCFSGELQTPANQHPAYLECPTCGAVELVYTPLPHQEEFHETPYVPDGNGGFKPQIIGLFGGFGSSKSRASLEEMLLRCLENPNGTGLFCAPTLGQLKKTTMKTWFNEICPPHLIESFNKSDSELKMVNGFTWYFIPTDDEEKLRSINAGLIHMEESSGIKRTIYDQLLTRMRDPFTKVKTMIVCFNPSLGWIKDVLVDNEKRKDPAHPEHDEYNPYITTYVWPTHLNTYLPPDFIEMNSRGKPAWWIERYLNGSFNHSDGMVYPNVVNTFTTSAEYGEIPKHWERAVSMDWGMRNPTAVLFHAINPDKGEVITYQEYYVAGRTAPEHAKALKPLVDEIPAGLLRFMVADPSTKNKTDPINGKSVQGLFQEYGLFFQPGNNAIEAGIMKVNSYIERGRWKILTDKCPNLAKEIVGYKFPELTMDDEKNPDEKPVKFNDHACDSARYFFMRLPDDPDLLKNVAYEPPKKYSKHIDDEDDYEDEEYEGSDFLSYV